MTQPWVFGALSLASLTAAWLIHTRLRAFLPEDPPAIGRKRHQRPTPMAGGLPAALAITAAALAGLYWLAAATFVATGVGLLDDIHKSRSQPGDTAGLGWRPKATGLLVAAALATFELGAVDWPMRLAALLFLFVLTNALNFLDNQNGVATVLGLVALLIVGQADPLHPATWTAACWAPFLLFNWPRARMFLGDSGAYALGLGAATFALRAATLHHSLDWSAALVPVAIPLLDFTQVVTARLVLGYAPWVGDRRHLTHLLLLCGLPAWSLAPILATAALLPPVFTLYLGGNV